MECTTHDAETQQQQFCQHITECQQRREQDAEYIAEREKNTGLSPWRLDAETPEINDIIDAIEQQGGFVKDRAQFELLHSPSRQTHNPRYLKAPGLPGLWAYRRWSCQQVLCLDLLPAAIRHRRSPKG